MASERIEQLIEMCLRVVGKDAAADDPFAARSNVVRQQYVEAFGEQALLQ